MSGSEITHDRVRALVELANRHIAGYRRTGPSYGPPAPADLDAAVEVLTEAQSVAGPEHVWLPRIEQMLARLLMARYVAHSGPTTDSDRAIGLFRAVIDRDELRDGDTETARLALAALLILRLYPTATRHGPNPSFGTIIAGAGDLQRLDHAATRTDLDCAVHHLEAAMKTGRLPSELVPVAPALLASAQLLRQMFGGPGLDMVALIGNLTRALLGTPNGSPARIEIGALRAWLVADSIALPPADAPPSTPDQIVEAEEMLTASLAELPEGNDLRPALLEQLAIVTAARIQRSGPVDDFGTVEQLLQRALDDMPTDYPLRKDTAARLAAAAVSGAAYDPTTDGVDRVVALATAVLESHDGDQRTGGDHFLVGMALLMRAYRDADDSDHAAAVDHLRTALARISPGDPLEPTVMGLVAAVLNDRHLRHGVIEDAEAAGFYFARAEAALAARPDDPLFTGLVRGMRGLSGASIAIRSGDPAGLALAVTDMTAALDLLPSGYPWRSRPHAALGLAHLVLGVWRADVAEIRKGTRVIEEVLTKGADRSTQAGLLALAGFGALLTARLDTSGPEAEEERGIDLMRRAVADGGFGPDQRAALHSALGSTLLIRATRTGVSSDFDAAVTVLEKARDDAAGTSLPGLAYGLAVRTLAEAYHRRGQDGDLVRAIHTGLDGIRAWAADVFLQTGAEHAVTSARGVAEAAATVAGWCLAAGRPVEAVEAVELGRGLVLHIVTAATTVGEMLRADGHGDLADEWDRTPLPPPAWTGPTDPFDALTAETLLTGRTPDDLRLRVLGALRSAGRIRHLVSAPGIAETAAAVGAVGAVALVYLLPAAGDRPGALLTVEQDGTVHHIPAPELRLDRDGPVAAFADADADVDGKRWTAALENVCGWAWPAAIAPLLAHLRPDHVTGRETDSAHRVVLVPTGAAGGITWHAARTTVDGRHRYACADLVISYAASARQLVDVAGRDPLPVGDDPVFVANPLGDQGNAVFETLALRMIFYPRSHGYGSTGERADGPGTPDEVLSHIPGRDAAGASLLHLSCHGQAAANPAGSHLMLVDGPAGSPAPLPVGRILRRAHGRPSAAAGGLVVLSACTSDLTIRDYDEALTLATAFVSAGATGVVGTRWAVSDRLTPPVMFMFHHFLMEEGLPPAHALRATQLWLLDPDRSYPATLPELFRGDLERHDFTNVFLWAAFCLQGR